MDKTLGIIGCGASGMAAAIEASRYFKKHEKTVRIIIFERLSKPGKKILATGNGRCNIMNNNPTPDMYGGDKHLLKCVLEIYSVESNIAFFKSMGLYLAEDDEGRMYPMSYQASSVLDALRFETEHLGIEIITDTKIDSIKIDADKFILNDVFKCDSIIIAGGGKSASVQGSDGSCFELLKSLGIKIKTPFPSLTGIILKKKNRFLKGVRAAGEILAVESDKVISSSSGELQYTDFGISGIPAMDISREISEHFGNHRKGKIIVSVNSLPNFTPEEIFDYIMSRKKYNPDLLCENILSGVMPKKLGISKLYTAGVDPSLTAGTLTKNQIAEITEIINSDIFEVSGVMGFENSQVTAGGADTKQFNSITLGAKSIKGLYACGEVLDIDGRCGGYNLTWAWSSGRCAGANAAEYLSEKE